MPAAPNYAEVAALTEKLNTLGVDNISLLWNKDTKADECHVGWQDLKVKGVGWTPTAAMEDAYQKMRAQIILNHPEVTLPPE
jgi:hypothetical protein